MRKGRVLEELVLAAEDGADALVAEDVANRVGEHAGDAQHPDVLGATAVYACATHAVFSGPALERIRDSVMTEVVVTDTIPVPVVGRPENIRVLSVAGVLADTIRNVFCDESVSSIFGGENQLF